MAAAFFKVNIAISQPGVRTLKCFACTYLRLVPRLLWY